MNTASEPGLPLGEQSQDAGEPRWSVTSYKDRDGQIWESTRDDPEWWTADGAPGPMLLSTLHDAFGPLVPLDVDNVAALLADYDATGKQMVRYMHRTMETDEALTSVMFERDTLKAELAAQQGNDDRFVAVPREQWREAAEAVEAVERVRAIHVGHEGRCTECVEPCDCLDRVYELGDDYEVAATARMCPHGNKPWPCPTAEALASADTVSPAPKDTPKPEDGGGQEAPPDIDRCLYSKRVDQPGTHSWRFDGDDPRVECVYCGQLRDALSGHVYRESNRG